MRWSGCASSAAGTDSPRESVPAGGTASDASGRTTAPIRGVLEPAATVSPRKACVLAIGFAVLEDDGVVVVVYPTGGCGNGGDRSAGSDLGGGGGMKGLG